MSYVPRLQTSYEGDIKKKLQEQFDYSSSMEVPRITKICLNQGIGKAVADKKMIDTAVGEMSAIAGQRAIPTYSSKDVSNFKLRKGMPIGCRVTLRRVHMYEFLDRLIAASLPRTRDFRGVNSKFDSMGNYTMGIKEHIIFPEILIDQVDKIIGMDITFVTTAKTDEEGYALLKEFGVPFKNLKN